MDVARKASLMTRGGGPMSLMVSSGGLMGEKMRRRLKKWKK